MDAGGTRDARSDTPSLRVAIEATAACRASRGGVARYTVGLVRSLVQLEQLERNGDRFELCYRLSRWKDRALRLDGEGLRSRWIQEPIWPLRPGVDVVHGTDARVPSWRGAVRVATVHDVFSLLFDGFAPESFRRRKARRYRDLTRTCDRILAVSRATKEDFLRFCDYPAQRIDVVHEGVDPSFRPLSAEESAPVLQRHALGRPYLLYVGELSRRKNLPGLIRAYAAAGLADDFELVLAGAPSFGDHEVHEAIAAAGLERHVRLLGYVPEGDLPALYSAARAFVFPTHYEGFGLPVLEAMACGTAVLAGVRGAVPEIAGGHAVLVEPGDPASIRAGLLEVVATAPERLDAARRHTRRFTWLACARATREAYLRALREGRAAEASRSSGAFRRMRSGSP